MKSFKETMRRNPKVDEKARELFMVREFARYDVAMSKVVLKSRPFTVEGLALFMKDNNQSDDSEREVMFYGIILALVSSNIIPAEKADDEVDANGKVIEADEKIVKMLKGVNMSVFLSLAKTLAIAALHAYVHGFTDAGIKWYNYFQAVKGNFLAESKASKIFKLIHSSGSLQTIMDIITVKEIKSESNACKYRFMRLSTPALVKEALNAFPFETIYSFFPCKPLLEYIEFDNAGILAQIAAGPLKTFCVGEVYTLKVANIPDNLILSDLKAIPEPPHNKIIIRRAKMILDKIGYEYGNWYQGARSSAGTMPEDLIFRALVDQLYDRIFKQPQLPQELIDSEVSKIDSMVKFSAEKAKKALWLGK